MSPVHRIYVAYSFCSEKKYVWNSLQMTTDQFGGSRSMCWVVLLIINMFHLSTSERDLFRLRHALRI